MENSDKLMFERAVSSEDDYRFSGSRQGAHRKIIDLVGSNKTVLDVGCGSGYLGLEFKKNNCTVVGIEADAKRSKEAAKAIDKVISADIEQSLKIDLDEKYFDVIVLADVLEHLVRPDLALINLRRYLKDDGRIVVSVPNVARIDSRLNLLSGKFEYGDTGIFDKTHLRFFTQKSITALIEQAGYSVLSTDYTGIVSRYPVLRIFSGLLAFQIIIHAKAGR